MEKKTETYDVVVCGGGLAGLSAAVTAARHGAKTCIIQDRPVFGGNSSSEVRVTPCGAASFHGYARETGLISEWLIEERARNHEPAIENGWTNSVWDLILYDTVVTTPNLTSHLNTTVTAIQMKSDRLIDAVVCRVSNAETELTVFGTLFIDCTGDGLVADLSGCEWRMGCEARSEYNEPHAPLAASSDTMGSSLLFKAKDVGQKVKFIPPDWAVKFDNDDYFYKEGRVPYNVQSGYWWIELGMPWNTITDNETIRHELTRHLLGVWDWVKNKDPRMKDLAENWALDWIGQVPGKRESRRIIGDYVVTEHDLLNLTVFPDEVAFGGWYIDLHTPGGLLAGSSEPTHVENWSPDPEYAAKSYCGPYGIPLRSLVAKDLDNLLMAGRNLSATHAALGSIRVMQTTAVMGQAAGTAAAIAVTRGISIREVHENAITEVKQTLLKDGCFLPNNKNEDVLDLARRASVSASSEAVLYGAGPHGQRWSESLFEWGQAPERVHSPSPLKSRHGQWIAVNEDRLENISVCLNNHSGQMQKVEARLVPVDHIWDYRSESKTPLACAFLNVPAGQMQWITWPVGLGREEGLEPGRYYRLDLLPNSQIEWCVAANIEMGHLSAMEISDGKMRRLRTGVTLSFQVEPPQHSFGAQNILSGVTRPHRFTNAWRSDPAQPLPQWIELTWDEPLSINEVDITFPGHLLRDHYYYSPLFKDPLCPSDYEISAWCGDKWVKLLSVTGNYQRLRQHKLSEAVQTNKLRVTILATNGDPSASIFEIRCY